MSARSGSGRGGLRRDYRRGELLETEAGDDPFRLFDSWMSDAVAGGFLEPTAMALATADPRGRPSVRMVLLKRFDREGFVFFTNLESRKGVELAANPFASAVLWWDRLERQIRIEGSVEPVRDADSNAYFASRPIGSRLAAWASPQSRPVDGREALERRIGELEQRHPDGVVPRPPWWGGLRLVPETIEFWQGRQDRLHDRLVYRREPDARWSRRRLGP